MICGCAVVCTDCKGYLEMATNGENALVVPVGDAEKMAQAIIKLISNDTLRITIAENGRKSIQQFKWDNSFIEFKELLHSVS
jgi:glycosyltransferase involved in cell wall biosynthesis